MYLYQAINTLPSKRKEGRHIQAPLRVCTVMRKTPGPPTTPRSFSAGKQQIEWPTILVLKGALAETPGSSHKQCLGPYQNLGYTWYCSCLTMEQCPECIYSALCNLQSVFPSLDAENKLAGASGVGWMLWTLRGWRRLSNVSKVTWLEGEPRPSDSTFSPLSQQLPLPTYTVRQNSNAQLEMNHTSAAQLRPLWLIRKISHSCRGSFFLFSLYEIMNPCQRLPWIGNLDIKPSTECSISNSSCAFAQHTDT